MSTNINTTALDTNRVKKIKSEPIGKGKVSPLFRLLLLLALALGASALFMCYDLKGNLSYILNRRATILATMVVVAFCAGISTVLFQTIANNRILSPSIMGFEYLFILIQTSMLFMWGEQGLSMLTSTAKFMLETGIMILFSLTLYLWLFRLRRNNLYLILLIGIICGSFFNSTANLMQRMLNPDEFAILQTRMFATFNTLPNMKLLITAIIICLIVTLIIWRLSHSIDVLTLGRESAITLGLNYSQMASFVLVLTSILVSISTALVGPLTFFGFLVASLTYQCMRTYRHAYLLPAAVLVGVISLVGGQFFLQHVLSMTTTLTVVINFIGGLLFIVILIKRASL